MAIRNVLLLLFAMCLPGVSLAQADTAPENDLRSFFSNMQSLKADFTQQVFGPRQELLQDSSGQVIVQRPGKFRWDYNKPYQQHIVADGKKLWLFDVDLEQVSIKPQNAAMANSPASLLSDPGQLDKQFDVLMVFRHDRNWFELIPKQSDSGFEALFILLDDGVISQMELKDSFGQFTRLRFENVRLNKHYGADTFRLKIPEGVDVIDETAAQ